MLNYPCIIRFYYMISISNNTNTSILHNNEFYKNKLNKYKRKTTDSILGSFKNKLKKSINYL